MKLEFDTEDQVLSLLEIITIPIEEYEELIVHCEGEEERPLSHGIINNNTYFQYLIMILFH